MSETKKSNVASPSAGLESLEDRRMMVYWPGFVGMDAVFQQYPWLNGGGNGVAVVDKGIDYYHPRFGGNQATGTKSPFIVNVWDYEENDADPFPEDPASGPTGRTGHATGVTGILAMLPFKNSVTTPVRGDGNTYRGILQGSKIFNLRTSDANSQESIRAAFKWVLDNHRQYNITALNLTDFFGTSAASPLYAAEVKALWDAGIFIATPVANNWLGDPETGVPPHTTIGYPGKSPYIFSTGGLNKDGNGPRAQTQRGVGLDLLAPAENVWIPYYNGATGNHEYVPGTGNSWGTPMVVGTAVLIQQIDPTIRPEEIMKIIQDGGVWVADSAANAAISGVSGYKRLDMLGAIKLAYQVRDDGADQGAGNDTLATAANIALDANGNGTLAGQKLLIHDHDYYTFTVGADGQYDLSAVAGAQLMDASGNVIATAGADGTFARQALAGGQYFVHLYDAGKSLTGTYSIGIQQHVEPPPPPPAVPGDNGTFNDVKYDADGNLHFVWFDAADKTLKYAVRDSSKVWGAVQTIDSAANVGNFVSMALDSAGKPAVAYYDATNADLKYASFDGSAWTAQTVDATNTVGYYPSLKFDAANNPVIAYYYKTGGDLKVATNTGSGWQTSTIDSSGDVGRYASLAMNPATGAWAIAYEATGAGAFKYAQRNSSTWSVTTVDQNGLGGGFISLAFDNHNRPAFSYYDAKNADLKLARFNGSVWSTTAVATKNNQGMYTNLFFDGNDAVIYYFNKTTGSLLRAKGGGSVFSTQTLVAGGGRESHVARTAGGAETFSYFDQETADLKVTDL